MSGLINRLPGAGIISRFRQIPREIPLRHRLRLAFARPKQRFGRTRIVITESRQGFKALIQSRWRFFHWQTVNRTEVYKHFPALLMELGDIASRVQQSRGVKIPRQQRRLFGRKIGQRV